MRKIINLFSKANIIIGGLLLISPILIISFGQTGIFDQKKISANDSERETRIITEDPIFSDGNFTQTAIIRDFDIPKSDAINYGNRLRINSVGIDTYIWEGEGGSNALNKGVWRMPYHGTPEYTDEPTVLAAHRWGEDGLDWTYRLKNLFLQLPEVKVGDIIEIDWFGESLKYRVTHTEVSTTISKTDDLILVTCQDYYSPERVFVFAEKVESV